MQFTWPLFDLGLILYQFQFCSWLQLDQGLMAEGVAQFNTLYRLPQAAHHTFNFPCFPFFLSLPHLCAINTNHKAHGETCRSNIPSHLIKADIHLPPTHMHYYGFFASYSSFLPSGLLIEPTDLSCPTAISSRLPLCLSIQQQSQSFSYFNQL